VADQLDACLMNFSKPGAFAPDDLK